MTRAWRLIIAAYAAALAAALVKGAVVPFEHPLAVAAAADVAATVVVFAFSLVFRNSSFYDAYWSVAPFPIAAYWVLRAGDDANGMRQLAVLALLAIWGARLTYNWARGWQGLDHEDWRYLDLKSKSGRAYWLVSFAGIHMFPTVVVFLALLPVWVAVSSARPLGALDVLALAVAAGAIWIEARADRELHDFRAARPAPGAILSHGVWAWSRHPNYFGEMSFWWGMWLFGVAAAPHAWWWTAAGPLVITLMFRFVSLPMMEERMRARRPAYAAHAARTSLVVPWPPRARA